MAEILEQLNGAKLAAMKAKMASQGEDRAQAELRLDVIRGVLGEIERDSKNKKPRGAAAVLKSEHSKRVESSEVYREAGVGERADREAAEAAIVAEFLPKEPTALELQYFIADFVGAAGLEGAGNAGIGQVMAVVREEFKDFDGKLASDLARQILSPKPVDGPAVAQ